MPLYVAKDKCPQNHRCPLLSICPQNAISQEGFGLPSIDHSKCVKCGKCIKYCGMGAVYKN